MIPIPLQAGTLVQKKIGAKPGTLSQSTDPAALNGLAEIQAVLQGQGITDLSDLGTLPISGAVKPTAGTFVRAPFVKAAPGRAVGTVNFATAAEQVLNASRIFVLEENIQAPTHIAPAERLAKPLSAEVPRLSSQQFSGPALRMIGQPLAISQTFGSGSAHAETASIPISQNTAYWAANAITFGPDTNIVLSNDVRFLIIIASSITGAANVTLTYEEIPFSNPPGTPGTPQTPLGQPPVPNPFHVGDMGYGGAAGTQPLQIGAPPNAPEVELWVLNIDAVPNVLLKGQTGYQGVQGGDGQQGGIGSAGSSSVNGWGDCTHGPGNGGNGGPGGRGGDGGAGGNGGNGGRFSLYTATNISGMSFNIDVSGGIGGVGGQGGFGGKGGPGGKRGNISGGFCDTADHRNRPDGSQGSSGGRGSQGPNGAPGLSPTNAETFWTIAASDFLMKLTDPAITSIATMTSVVNVGTSITINGLRFTPSDQVTIGGVAATSTFVADNMLQCVVPNTAGGLSKVQVTRTSGSQGSNYATLFITPTIVSTVPANLARLRPGTWVQICGTGFSPKTTVRVNGTQITQPSATDTHFKDTQNLEFMMKRPNSVPRLAVSGSGEPALLSVASAGPILLSNAIPIMVATYQMVVIGDSVAWGEGLQEADKWSTKVGAHVTAVNAGMSVYRSGAPHTGAILGWNAGTGGAPFNGDIPKSYPSVREQAQDLVNSGIAPTVDLVVVTATANDVGAKYWLDPGKTEKDILPRVKQFCHDEMLAFLVWLAAKFPAAKIIATGYYPMVSHESKPNLGIDVAAVFMGMENNQGLEPKALAVKLGLSPGAQPAVAKNTEYFVTAANAAISLAVKDGNQAIGAPTRLYFANPGFGTQNAAYAPEAWVFGVDVTLNGLEPTDSVASAHLRATECAILTNVTDRLYCEIASTGHPNTMGAASYANAINGVIDTM